MKINFIKVAIKMGPGNRLARLYESISNARTFGIKRLSTNKALQGKKNLGLPGDSYDEHKVLKIIKKDNTGTHPIARFFNSPLTNAGIGAVLPLAKRLLARQEIGPDILTSMALGGAVNGGLAALHNYSHSKALLSRAKTNTKVHGMKSNNFIKQLKMSRNLDKN